MDCLCAFLFPYSIYIWVSRYTLFRLGFEDWARDAHSQTQFFCVIIIVLVSVTGTIGDGRINYARRINGLFIV